MNRKDDMKKKDTGNNHGFTLIEVLIALAVFAIGILGVFTLQMTAINGNASARGVTENYLSGMDKVEELMARPYDHNLLDDTTTTGDWHTLAKNADGIDNDGDGTIDEAGETGDIDIEWWVEDDTIWEQPIKRVTVRVTSTVNGNRRKTINFDFIRAQL